MSIHTAIADTWNVTSTCTWVVMIQERRQEGRRKVHSCTQCEEQAQVCISRRKCMYECVSCTAGWSVCTSQSSMMLWGAFFNQFVIQLHRRRLSVRSGRPTVFLNFLEFAIHRAAQFLRKADVCDYHLMHGTFPWCCDVTSFWVHWVITLGEADKMSIMVCIQQSYCMDVSGPEVPRANLSSGSTMYMFVCQTCMYGAVYKPMITFLIDSIKLEL